MNLFNFFKPKKNTEPTKSLWRNNMWVMTPDGIGIVFQLGEPSLIHLVDEIGETKSTAYFATTALRQALWEEIPEARRKIDREKGHQLGYF